MLGTSISAEKRFQTKSNAFLINQFVKKKTKKKKKKKSF